MTPERLNEIDARAKAATPGLWESGDGWVFTLPVYEDDNRLSNVLGMPYANLDRAEVERERAQRNADFIAAARTDVPDLVSVARSAQNWAVHYHQELEHEREVWKGERESLVAELAKVRDQRDRAMDAIVRVQNVLAVDAAAHPEHDHVCPDAIRRALVLDGSEPADGGTEK